MNFRITFKFFFNPIYGVPTIIKQGEECFSPPSQNGTMPNQGFETEELYFSPTNPELSNKFSQETIGTRGSDYNRLRGPEFYQYPAA